jgi:hypothetical protein
MAIRHINDTTFPNTSPEQLRDKMVFADVIAVQFPNGNRTKLWSRPLAEFTGPGPYKVNAVVIDVANRADFKRLRKMVNQLKFGD